MTAMEYAASFLVLMFVLVDKSLPSFDHENEIGLVPFDAVHVTVTTSPRRTTFGNEKGRIFGGAVDEDRVIIGHISSTKVNWH